MVLINSAHNNHNIDNNHNHKYGKQQQQQQHVETSFICRGWGSIALIKHTLRNSIIPALMSTAICCNDNNRFNAFENKSIRKLGKKGASRHSSHSLSRSRSSLCLSNTICTSGRPFLHNPPLPFLLTSTI